MERLIIAVIIIAAVLFLFRGGQQGGQTAGGTFGGSRIGGPGNVNTALPPGYRSSSPG